MAGENRILRHCRQAPAGSAARERRQDMSEKADRFRDYDITTRAVHTGNDYDKETGTYNFHFVLAVSAGSFGHFWESFVPASESTQNAAPKMASSKVSLKEKNPGKAFVNFLRIPAERDPQPIKAKVTVSHNKREKVSGRNQVEFSAR